MRNYSLPRAVLTAVTCLVVILSSISTAFGQETASSIGGVVSTSSGAPLAGAKITITGPVATTATSSGDGSFSATVPPGVYQVRIDHGGYQSASLADVSVVPGTKQPLTVTLSAVSLDSLRTIGTVTAAANGRSSINMGPAAQSYIPAQAFAEAASPQINDVLQRAPDVVIEHMGVNMDTSITVGGLQPYETQVLIDGHPIALGQYGVYTSQYFPSFLIGGVEVESGPGNTTPFANLAVGGTVNLTTPAFTTKPTASFTTGTDSYGSIYNNLVASGTIGRLGYVIGGGTSWNNTPYSNKTECDVYESDPATSPNSPGFAGIVPFCGVVGGSLFTRGQLYKLKYDFSSATSFEADFVGSYGGYTPQGYSSGISYGPTLVESCIPGTLECTSPSNQNLIGQTINGVLWYPGTQITNKQQMYSGQFRTSIGNDTLLIRPYIGNIEPETYNGTDEGNYPAFFAPNSSYPACTSLAPTTTCYPGPQSLAPGVQIPGSGLPNPNAFESTTCPPGSMTSFQQINSPANTITTVNGQEECYQYPYSTSETDTLYGNTLTYIHPFGDNYLNFTYDFHGQSTFAYADSPANFFVPQGSATRFSTFSLTGALKPVRNLAVNFGLYTTLWTASGDQPLDNVASGTVTEVGLQRSVSRTDPHVALVFHPVSNTSYRAAFGTSETFPFIGLLSGPAAIAPPSYPYTAGYITQKNPNLLPEQSIAYDLGVDHRFPSGGVLSLDLQDTTVHDVFQDITTVETVTYNGAPAVLGILSPVNVAQLQSKLVTAKYSYAPRTGLGYNLSLAADSSILHGIPPAAFNSGPGLPADNVQICGSVVSADGGATCIPYLKGYGQLTYAWRGGMAADLGVDYEGKNNAYYQPPFAVIDLSLRHPVGKMAELQLSVQNLLNNNTLDNLPEANAGTPVTGNYTTDGVTVQQGSYVPFALPAAPRTARLQLRLHLPN